MTNRLFTPSFLGETGPSRAPPAALRTTVRLFIGLVSIVVATGCATVRPRPEPIQPGWSETGIVSWYGEPFHGRRTASGEIYDMDAMTAAHPWLPFGTRVAVRNRDNRRTAVVRINDRGPFKAGRIIDLSRAAARQLRMLGPGTARVRVTVEDLVAPAACLDLQVGAYRVSANAQSARKRLERAGLTVRVESGRDGLLRVIAGPFRDLPAVRRAQHRFGGFVRPCRGE